MTVRTRFAPSPTGYLHIGGVRTALFNWLLARQAGGQFILRIDDTDSKRNVAEALQPILDGFQWLGIDWDEGPTADGSDSQGPHAPYFQSQRLANYQAAVQQLLDSGHAYRDYARPEETQAEREAAEKEKREFIYSRKYMAETDEQAAEFEAEGRSAIVRLKIPREGSCDFTDLICGEQSIQWRLEQDHVIQRNDGTCLYHLANVVDDHDFQITHVVRGIEHLSNTPRQIFILESLGYSRPVYAHIPFVAEPGSKKKLSKRKLNDYLKHRDFQKLNDLGMKIADLKGMKVDGEGFNPVLVDFYKQIGFLPAAINNYLLLLGWALDGSRENFTREEMIEHFSLERVVKAAASFDPAKLQAFQQRYMTEWDLKRKVAACLPYLQSAGLVDEPPSCETGPYLNQIVDAAGDRIILPADILNFDDFFRADDQLEINEKAFQKRIVKPDDAGHLLNELNKVLRCVDDWSVENLEKVLKEDFCVNMEIKIGQIIHALRVAVTGKAAGFGMFETLAILGKEKSVRRIDLMLEEIASGSNDAV